MQFTVSQRRTTFWLLAAPFFLNDFGLVALEGTYGAYLLDYSIRLSVLLIGLWWPVSRAAFFEQTLQPGHIFWAVSAVIVLPVATRLFFHFIEVPLFAWSGTTGFFQWHKISNPVFYWLDLLPGLLLVALSEELVFRKLALSWLRAANRSNWQIMVISAAIFALAHWSNGPGSILAAFLTGLLFMAAYLLVGRLWPLVLAHWLANAIAFGPW